MDRLVVAWDSDASIYIPANYPIMQNLDILLHDIIFGTVGNITQIAILVYAGSVIPGMAGHQQERL